MKKALSLFLAAILATSLLTSCRSGDGDGNTTTTTTKAADGGNAVVTGGDSDGIATIQPQPERNVDTVLDTLVLGADEFNGVFSPFFATSAYDMDVVDQIFSTLIKNDELGRPVSDIAEYVDPEVTTDENGNEITVYTFKLLDGVAFSDGRVVTADDIIFSYKVYLDPMYDGNATLHSTPIIGVNEYRYDDPDYASKVAEIIEQAKDVSDEYFKEYLKGALEGDEKAYGTDAVVGYLVGEGFEDAEGKTGADLLAIYVECEFTNYYEDWLPEVQGARQRELEREYVSGNLEGGSKVPDIAGIEKVDDKTVKVTIEGVDPKAIWNLGGIEVVPAYYYGEGYVKGDLSTVKAKNGAPLGSGWYTFDKFENNVVYLVANPYYFEGVPYTKNVRYQIVSMDNKLESVLLGDCDFSDPSPSPEMIKEVESNNLAYDLIDNLGYGYIGINAARITDKNVRKGLMHLMLRYPAVETYYGELATVIERPMSRVSWAYPEGASEYYGYDTAKALEYFKAAGYEQSGGKLVKDGAQLRVEIAVGQLTTHPSAPIISQMSEALKELGGELVIQDVSASILFDGMNSGTWDMWCAAWQSTIDPDMYQVYHSSLAGISNNYNIKNTELDKLIEDARKTLNIDERKELYSKALDIVMDEAVEMPVYQRKNLYVYNPEHINTDTLYQNPTPFKGPFSDMHEVQLR